MEALHATRCSPNARGRIVYFGCIAGCPNRIVTRRDQHLSIEEQSRTVQSARYYHAAGGYPSAGGRVIKLCAGEYAGCIIARRNQNLAIREQRCSVIDA